MRKRRVLCSTYTFNPDAGHLFTEWRPLSRHSDRRECVVCGVKRYRSVDSKSERLVGNLGLW